MFFFLTGIIYENSETANIDMNTDLYSPTEAKIIFIAKEILGADREILLSGILNICVHPRR